MTRFDHMIGLWEDGARRIRVMDPQLQRVMNRVVSELTVELQRRVGVTFTSQELADYYESAGTDWCFELAYRAAPEDPEAWDVPVVAGAAFAWFVRGAQDYGGGVRKEIDPEQQQAS